MALEQAELEKLIEELESRVDRLRSLYEQYFMGLEKVVPAVPHKDVERRLYVLRRATIRNTGLRFRFQNILLKYNTYGTYWQRIVRQIEEGTYKRDVKRAKARFGPDATAAQVRRKSGRKGDAEVEVEVAEVDVDFDELDLDVELEEATAATATFEDEQIAKARAEVAKMRAALQGGKARPDADLTSSNAATERPPPPGAALSAEPSTEPKIPAARPAGVPRPEGAPEEAQPPTQPKVPVAARQTGSLPYAARGPKRPSVLPPALPIAELDTIPPAPPRPLPVPRPAPPPPPSPSSGAPLSMKRPSVRPVPRPSSKPAPPLPPRPLAPRPRPAAAPAKPAAPPNITDDRVRQLYTQLVETKRKVGESTAALTLESLSRSLRDSSEKLKQKHVGRNVDFEVTVKDGKAVLRPVVK